MSCSSSWRALHRERRDHEIAAGSERVVDLVAQRAAPLLDRGVRAVAIAIGALAHHVVEACGRVGIEVKDLLVRAEIAGEQRCRLPAPSSICSSIEAEPRMCPAFQKRARTPGPGSIHRS